MLLRKLDCASQWQQLNIFELNVLRGLVIELSRSEFGNQAISNVPIVVDDKDVFDANVLVVQEGLAQVADNFVEVLIALDTFQTECNSRHDGLFLLDDHARISADGPQVKVILDAEGEPEH